MPTLRKGNSAVYVGPKPKSVTVDADGYVYTPEPFYEGLPFNYHLYGPPAHWEWREGHVFFDMAANGDYRVEVTL
jgi:hypothetical protein